LSIFQIGPKREEVARGWRILHNEELHNFYTSTNIIRVIKLRKMRWVGHVGCMGKMRYRNVIGKPEGKRPLRRPGHRWKVSIWIACRKIVWNDVNWIHLAQDRDRWLVVNVVMNLCFIKGGRSS
jgi:hypothetical protein